MNTSTVGHIGRPVIVFDQRSHVAASILLNWNTFMTMWEKTQISHRPS